MKIWKQYQNHLAQCTCDKEGFNMWILCITRSFRDVAKSLRCQDPCEEDKKKQKH